MVRMDHGSVPAMGHGMRWVTAMDIIAIDILAVDQGMIFQATGRSARVSTTDRFCWNS